MYIIKRNSWHYKFNKFMISSFKPMPYNFCAYWSMTIWHFFKFIFVAAPFSIFAFVIGSVIYKDPIAALIAFGGTVVIIFIALILAWLITDRIPKAYKTKITEKQPGLIRMKYISWKERHCSPVKYVD